MISSVILSTLFTLFVTVSCCIRADFPSLHDSRLRILSTKLNIIFWALICPETIFFWAMRQWFEAGRVAKEFRDRGWTRRHGLFLLMGGFILCNKDGQPTRVLSSAHFKRLVRSNEINFPTLSATEIKEQSNLHPVFVLTALLQAVWFLAQFFSRLTSGLGFQEITQLDVVTAPLIIANWGIFLFTWKRPLDAKYHVLIRLKREPRNNRGVEVTDFDREDAILQIAEHKCLFNSPRSRTRNPLYSKSVPSRGFTWRSLFSLFLWPVRSIYNDIIGIIPPDSNAEFPEGTLKIPLFFVPDTVQQLLFLLFAAILSMGVSIVSFLFTRSPSFSQHFSSEVAQQVWRIASMTSTAFSALILGIMIISNFFNLLDSMIDFLDILSNDCLEVPLVFSLFIWFFVFVIGIFPFLVARVVLFLSSVIGFKSVPGGDFFVGQSWTDYLPHLS